MADISVKLEQYHGDHFGPGELSLMKKDCHVIISHCPVVLGMPMINRVIWAMKETELKSALEAWQSARYLFEYANYMAQLDPADNGITMPTNTGKNPTDLDEVVLMKNKITIPAIETAVLHCCMKQTMMMGCKLHVITQAMYLEDQVNLLNGVYMVKTYTKLHNGSRNVSVVLRNLTGKPVHLAAGGGSGKGGRCKCYSGCDPFSRIPQKAG